MRRLLGRVRALPNRDHPDAMPGQQWPATLPGRRRRRTDRTTVAPGSVSGSLGHRSAQGWLECPAPIQGSSSRRSCGRQPGQTDPSGRAGRPRKHQRASLLAPVSRRNRPGTSPVRPSLPNASRRAALDRHRDECLFGGDRGRMCRPEPLRQHIPSNLRLHAARISKVCMQTEHGGHLQPAESIRRVRRWGRFCAERPQSHR